VERCFYLLNPGQKFIWGRHVQAITHHLERVARGEIRRLVISVPPRHLKSLCASAAFPAWLLGRDPTTRIIAASYGTDLSQSFSLQTRRVMEADWYQRVFPGSRLDRARLTVDEFRTTRQGYRIATSVGGALTGRGGNLILIDDPLKAGEANSEAARETLWTWYQSTLSSRLDDPKTGAIVVIAQRLHQGDLIGRLIEQGGWQSLELPAIADKAQKIPIGTGVHWSRQPGELLHPERVGEAEIEQLKRELGTYNFEAQYQQRPVPPEGNLVKLRWFDRYYCPLPDHAYEAVVQSWDTAMVPGVANDYSVCTTWGIRARSLYLLDVFRGQLDYPSLRKKVIELRQKFKPTMVVVERAGSGISLYQDLWDPRDPWIFNQRAEGDKISRLAHQSAKIEAGRVRLPDAAPWLEAFESEIAAFPNGKHDDQVDSLTQFLCALDYRPWPIRDISMYRNGGLLAA
jgi:predicted phage terminase large subunit-like protein